MSIAFSADGKRLAIGKLYEKILIVDTASAETVAQADNLKDLGQVTALALNAAEDDLFAGGYSSQTLSWNIDEKGRLSN